MLFEESSGGKVTKKVSLCLSAQNENSFFPSTTSLFFHSLLISFHANSSGSFLLLFLISFLGESFSFLFSTLMQLFFRGFLDAVSCLRVIFNFSALWISLILNHRPGRLLRSDCGRFNDFNCFGIAFELDLQGVVVHFQWFMVGMAFGEISW